MKYCIVPESCRICLHKSKNLRSIYKSIDPGDEPPNIMVLLLAGIEIDNKNNQTFGLPHFICKSCSSLLNMAFQFRLKVLKAQHILDAYCNYKMNKTNDKCEFQLKDTTELDILDLQDSLEEDYVFEEDLVDNAVKVEELDVQFQAEHINMLADSECSEKFEYENTDIDSNTSQQMIDIQPSTQQEEIEIEELNQSQEHISIAIVKPKNTKSISKRKKKADNSEYICDICGNIFKNRGRMMDHRRRHETELLYQCELCDKQFSLREKLRQHLFTHSGVRPYKCSYCSRSFYYKSVKNAHEAIHKGHKPYVCEVCNKSFAYPHSLKKHKLIHADIKLYHCDYCDKDFRLQHHMKQHLETKSHQLQCSAKT